MACAHSFGEWCSECIDGLVRDYNALRQQLAVLAPLLGLVQALQSHAREHGWQDVDQPIADLLAYPSGFQVIGSGYEAGFDAGYAKGFGDGLEESAGDPRVERLEAGFKAIHSATNGEYSREDLIVLDALQAARDFAVRLARREEHIQQLIKEREAASPVPPPTEPDNSPHGPTLQQANAHIASIADHYGHGWVSGREASPVPPGWQQERAELRRMLARLTSATRDTLRSHHDTTNCCEVTRRYVLESEQLLERLMLPLPPVSAAADSGPSILGSRSGNIEKPGAV